jgi:hypothetical protein
MEEIFKMEKIIFILRLTPLQFDLFNVFLKRDFLTRLSFLKF